MTDRFLENVFVPNISGSFHFILFNYIDKYQQPNDTILLVNETKKVKPIFQKHFPNLKIKVLEATNTEYLDLNNLHPNIGTYNIVFSQATLEHVCRPSIAIENLSNFTEIGGHILIHTHTPEQPEHKFPYDCVRFLPDFFYQLENYLPLKVVEYEEWKRSICMAYERI